MVDETKPVTLYTLSDNPDDLATRIAKPVVTLIHHLDPSLDDGWLIIRRHYNEEVAVGYVAGVIDTDKSDLCDPPQVYRTVAGTFTLLHRRPRIGAENHLIAFYAPITAYEDWFGIVRPDNSWLPRTERPLYADEGD
ncbi:hypothetical protein ABIF78_007765 [Bradyrhizobium japonicum]